MNGDVGKLPSGAVYSTTPDTGAPMAVVPDYCVAVNGVAEGAEGLSPMSPSAPQDPSTYSLPQLKQMLSQQLEYYFSRYYTTKKNKFFLNATFQPYDVILHVCVCWLLLKLCIVL